MSTSDIRLDKNGIRILKPHGRGTCPGKPIRRIRMKAQYHSWRKAVLQRDKYTCQKCGTRDRRKIITAHHKTPLWKLVRKGLPLFDVENGITLCRKCHDEEDGK